MHVGVLTGGGDCPGLNAIIRAVTLALQQGCGARVTGIERGFQGLQAGRCVEVPLQEVAGRIRTVLPATPCCTRPADWA